MSEGPFYTMEYFDSMIYRGLEYSLPAEIIHNIQDLQKKLGGATTATASSSSSSYGPPGGGAGGGTSSYPESSAHNHRRSGGGNGSWIKPPAPVFKSTVVVQERNYLEKDIADIRVSLNKISEKNFDKIRDGILVIIAPYLDETKGAELQSFVDTIIDILVSNAFLSKINARLYRDISHIHAFFKDSLAKQYAEFIASYESAETLGAQNPKIIDRRRATTQFFLWILMDNALLPREQLFDIMETWLDRVVAWSTDQGKTAAVEEITENLFLLVVETHEIFSGGEKWDTFYEGLAAMSEKKAKDFPSLSNRAIFKFRDLMDLL